MVSISIIAMDTSGKTTGLTKEVENINSSLGSVCPVTFQKDTKCCIEVRRGCYEVLEKTSTINDAITVHRKHHSSKEFGNLWFMITDNFQGKTLKKMNRVWLCILAVGSKFLLLVPSNTRYDELIQLCNQSIKELQGHEIIHCDGQKRCIRDGQELRFSNAMEIKEKMESDHYLACTVTHGREYTLDDTCKGVKAVGPVLINDFGVYVRSVHKNFKIERAVTKIVTNATSVNATGASSGAFPICMYPHDHVFHVNFSNEETFEDVLDKLETMNQKQLMFFVSTRSALRDRIQNKYSRYSMKSTQIEKKK